VTLIIDSSGKLGSDCCEYNGWQAMDTVLSILHELTQKDDAWFAENGRYCEYTKGDILVQGGKRCDSVIFVLSGVVAIHATGVGKIGHVANGEIIGEMSFLDGSLPYATVTAVEAVKVLAIKTAKLRAKIDRDSQFAKRFYRVLALFLSARLRNTMATMREQRRHLISRPGRR
jgi:CRP/FNR family transcriptional regulator, cyclic AMP receptor protein